jgi:hypothetical protein
MVGRINKDVVLLKKPFPIVTVKPMAENTERVLF